MFYEQTLEINKFRLLGAYIEIPEMTTKSISLRPKRLIQQIMAAPLEQVAVALRLIEILNDVEAESVGAEVDITTLTMQLRYPISL